MNGQQKHEAMRRMVKGLHDGGYISDKDKLTLEYKLETGDLKVFEEIRGYLLRVADEIGK